MSDELNLAVIEARAKVAAHLERTNGDFQSGTVAGIAADVLALLADRARLAAQLATARALLMDCWHQLDGDVYVLPGGEVHPGAVTTIHALHAFLWPEGKTI